MATVTATRRIDSDIESVWAQIADVTLVENWHPGVATADLLSTDPTGLGATRQCNFYDGSDVVEEIVELHDDHTMRVEIRDFDGPMKSFEATWSLIALESGATQITLTMNYEMKLNILGNAMDVLVVKRRMPKLLNKVLARLEHHVMSGEIVGREFKLAA